MSEVDKVPATPDHPGGEWQITPAMKEAGAKVLRSAGVEDGSYDIAHEVLQRALAAASKPPAAEPVAWLDMRSEPANNWQYRVVATNPDFVKNNGAENFAPLYLGEQPRAQASDALLDLKLKPLHIKLLQRGAHGQYIGLSDDMMFRMGEIGALSELRQAGYAEDAKGPFPPGPRGPTPSVITEAGRRALKAADPGRPVPKHGSGPAHARGDWRNQQAKDE